MIIYFYLFVVLHLNVASSSSIRSRPAKNEILPFLGSKSDIAKRDGNSLKIISNEPFIIQLGMSGVSDKRKKKEDAKKEADKKNKTEGNKRKKTIKKRNRRREMLKREDRIRRGGDRKRPKNK
ncbi:hypothetical protein RUM43_012695 [Polyplax serrata]|uniref:Uncharacterized protein n=1 Tax=Polyplax serrata TaxID=468196 RepID=A0AAN8S413_POLSC